MTSSHSNIRLRLRGPTSTAIVTLNDSDSVTDLQRVIRESTGLVYYEVRYGFPPRLLGLHEEDPNTPLSALDVPLNGEQLIVAATGKRGLRQGAPGNEHEVMRTVADEGGQVLRSTAQASNKSGASSQPPRGLIPLPSARRPTWEGEEAPQVPVPAYGGTLILRVMPDDNSCLFRAVGAAVMGSVDSMVEMRALIAEAIQSQPDIYSAAVLDQSPDEYCKWIQTEYAWGGAIELNILSQHFDVEICSIDVQTLRVDRFHEGRPKRIILVYSGIHYDTIALSPSEPPHTVADLPPELDERCFDSDEQTLLEKAVELCRVLQGQHYYTDTASFKIKCGVCGQLLVGESSARQHATETGHLDFREAN